MTQMLELFNKDFKAAIITILQWAIMNHHKKMGGKNRKSQQRNIRHKKEKSPFCMSIKRFKTNKT